MENTYSKFLNLNIHDIIGAVVSSIIVALVGYLSTVTNVMDIDYKQILNIAFLTGIASLLQAIGTTGKGNFLGVVKVK